MTVLQSIARPLQKICRNELLNIPHIYMHIYHLLSTPQTHLHALNYPYALPVWDVCKLIMVVLVK